MTKLAAALLLTVYLLHTGSAGAAEAPAQTSSPAYGTSVSIEPSGENTFLLKARVTDLASGEVVAGPAVKLASGVEGQTESQISGRDEVVTLAVTVDASSRTATYTLVIKHKERVISEHSAKVAM